MHNLKNKGGLFMLKNKLKILVAIVLVILMLSTFCYATDTAPISTNPTDQQTNTQEGADTTTTQGSSEDNWVKTDLYLCEDSPNVTQVVDGNAFIIGRDVTISGEIGGDLFVIADKLTINGGYVYSSIFAFANEITINGVVYDVYANCATLNLEKDGFIYRDLRVNADTINLNGKVRRNAHISANTIHLAEDIGTVIYGDLSYTTGKEMTFAQGLISGNTTYQASSNYSEGILSILIRLLGSVFYTFVLVMLLIWLTPKFVDRVTNMSTKKTFVSLGIGIVSPFVATLASILLILSVVGVTIFTSMVFAGSLLGMFGLAITSLFFGGLICKLLKQNGNVKLVIFTLISTIILWLLALIPYAGWVISLLLTLFGIGITLVNMVYRKESTKKEETPKKEKKVAKKKEDKTITKSENTDKKEDK